MLYYDYTYDKYVSDTHPKPKRKEYEEYIRNKETKLEECKVRLREYEREKLKILSVETLTNAETIKKLIAQLGTVVGTIAAIKARQTDFTTEMGELVKIMEELSGQTILKGLQ